VANLSQEAHDLTLAALSALLGHAAESPQAHRLVAVDLPSGHAPEQVEPSIRGGLFSGIAVADMLAFDKCSHRHVVWPPPRRLKRRGPHGTLPAKAQGTRTDLTLA